jgi:outer membrane protein assembly factor BamE (lipoprotein component of BamABCDE complex)
MKSAMIKGAAALLAASLIAGCTLSTREHRGYVKESVERTLGRPTFTGTFDQNDWYYVARDTRAFAFRNPRVTDQTVLHVRFDQAGNVTAVRKMDETLVAMVDPADDKTPTLGRKQGFFDELLGGIGTITQPGLPGSRRPGQ